MSGSLDKMEKIEAICGNLRQHTFEKVENEEQPTRTKKKKVYKRPQMSQETSRFLFYMKREAQFLKKILSIDRDLFNGADIHEDVEYTLSYIDTRNRFWLQDIPYHVIEKVSRLESRRSRTRTPRPPSNLSQKSDSGAEMQKFAILELGRITELLTEEQYDAVIVRGKSLVERLAELPPGEVEMRPNITCNTCSLIGNAYLQKNDTDKALAYHTQDLEMTLIYDLPEAKSRAIDNVGRIYARKGDYEKAISIWLEKMALPMESSERAWLCHEIGYCYLALEHLDEAKSYGEVTIDHAKDAGDLKWQLDGNVLLAQANLKSGSFVQAFECFQEALNFAGQKGDKESEANIRDAMDELNEVMVSSLHMKRMIIQTPPPMMDPPSESPISDQPDQTEAPVEDAEGHTVSKTVEFLDPPHQRVPGSSEGGSSRKSSRRSDKSQKGARRNTSYGLDLSHLKHMKRQPSMTEVTSFMNRRRQSASRSKEDDVILTGRESRIVAETRHLGRDLERKRKQSLKPPTSPVRNQAIAHAQLKTFNRNKGHLSLVKPAKAVARITVKVTPERYATERRFIEKELYRQSLH